MCECVINHHHLFFSLCLFPLPFLFSFYFYYILWHLILERARRPNALVPTRRFHVCFPRSRARSFHDPRNNTIISVYTGLFSWFKRLAHSNHMHARSYFVLEMKFQHCPFIGYWMIPDVWFREIVELLKGTDFRVFIRLFYNGRGWSIHASWDGKYTSTLSS